MSQKQENQPEAGSSTGWPSNQEPEAGIQERRDSWRAQYAESDALARIEVGENFEPFTQREDMFSRAFWDESISSDATFAFFKGHMGSGSPRRAAGFTQKI